MNDLVSDNEFYKTGWRGGLPETKCGHGSKVSETIKQREWIPNLIEKFKIKTISDIGAGDLNWINRINFPSSVKYTPYDLIPRDRRVNHFNILTSVPPESDLLMCLWVLNHFSDDDKETALTNLLLSGSKYLLITQRHSEIKYSLQIEDMIVLNQKRDVLMLVKL